jgi:hypothetical protein
MQNEIQDLDTHDCVSCLWKTSKVSTDAPPHFSGNIWWSKSSYINTLNIAMLQSRHRYDREFWIGSGLPKVKIMEPNKQTTMTFTGTNFPPVLT